MRINLEQKSIDMEPRDINYIMAAYIKSYMFYNKNEAPERIVFPMLQSVPHPYKAGVQVPIEWIPPLDQIAVEIVADSSNIPEVSAIQEQKLDEKDEEIKRLKAELLQSQMQQSIEARTIRTSPRTAETKPDIQLPSRTPRMPPGGDVGAGSPDDMHSRDIKLERQIKGDLRDEPDIDETKEKPFEKKVKRDKQGKPVVE